MLFTEITVSSSETGKPFFTFEGESLEFMKRKKAHVSISHEDDLAVAFVTIESERDE